MSNKDFVLNLYNEHYKTIAAVIKSTIYSKLLQDIDDCVQEVFLAALENENLRNHANIEGWLYKTTRNVVLVFNKKYTSQSNSLLIIDDGSNEFTTKADDFSEQLIEDIEFERLVKLDSIEKILNTLSKTEREFYRLKYEEKLNYKQISEITGKSEGSLRVRYNRLKEKIEKLVKKYVTNEV